MMMTKEGCNKVVNLPVVTTRAGIFAQGSCNVGGGVTRGEWLKLCIFINIKDTDKRYKDMFICQ